VLLLQQRSTNIVACGTASSRTSGGVSPCGIKKPATKERKGINPFTGEATVFKAKPARKVVKGRPVKAVKDAVA
jgi:hypothetical protein